MSLGTGAKIGIAVGALVLVGGTIGAIIYFKKKKEGNGLVGGSGQSMPTPTGDNIAYISPRISGGKVINSGIIEVRLTTTKRFKANDVVNLFHPNYNNTYVVSSVQDSPSDAGQFVFIETPYVDKGEVVAGNPRDTTKGGKIDLIPA
jgi:hypothetical protein